MTTSLTYFDFDGSRGLECRLALTVAGVPFEDIRLDRAGWAALKPSTPYGAMPILNEDGRALAHSNAILTYVGRTHGLHPSEPWAAAQHEAIMVSVEDLRSKLPGRPGMPDDEKKTAREEFAAGWLTQWAKTVDASIAGPFVGGNELNVVDLKVAVIVRGFLSGIYDHLPGSFFDAYPKILGLVAAVNAHPAVAAYFASR